MPFLYIEYFLIVFDCRRYHQFAIFKKMLKFILVNGIKDCIKNVKP